MLLWLSLALLLYFLLLYSRYKGDPDPPAGHFHVYAYRESDPSRWNLWAWNAEQQASGRAYAPRFFQDGWLFFDIPLAELSQPKRLGFLLRKGEWEVKEGEDRIVALDSAPHQIYLLEGRMNVTTRRPRVKPRLLAAFLDSATKIQVHLPYGVDPKTIDGRSLWLKLPNQKRYTPKELAIQGRDLILHFEKPFSLADKSLSEATLGMKGYQDVTLTLRGILYEATLDYSEPLGLTFHGGKAVIRCFAPTASHVCLVLYAGLRGEKLRTVPMAEVKTGLYEVTANEADWMGLAYQFLVTGADHNCRERLVLDPYSKMHISASGPSLIFRDEFRLSPAPVIAKRDCVIWETHIRDFSIKRTCRYPGKYLAFTEPDNLLYLKQLGVNVIQLLPVQDFNHGSHGGYDWGYMPNSWFCLEGWYATCQTDTSRIHEFRNLVNTLHEHGFLVVMDVVYNHRDEAMPPHSPGSLNGLAPGYYYRRNHHGLWFNGSGCGNEFKSEAPMGRRMILDSLEYFMNHFGVDGFRFDLMGLIDFNTQKEIVRRLQAINPHVLIYGEPWAAGESGIEVVGKGAQRGLSVSVFNDHYRDAIRGRNDQDSVGFVQAGFEKEKVLHGLLGSVHDFCEHPLESINYVACHDNYTLHDKLRISLRHSDITGKQIEAMEALAAVLVLMAPGIPFLHAGQEILRSKGMNHNSYNAPDSVNAQDWEMNPARSRLLSLYQNLIRLRKAHPLFRLSTRSEVLHHLSPLQDHCLLPPDATGVMWQAHQMLDGYKRALLVVHSGRSSVHFKPPSGRFCLVATPETVHLRHSELKEIKSELVLDRIDFALMAELNQEG